MTSRRAASPTTEADYLAWSQRWEAARSRAGWAPVGVLATGVVGGIALQWVLHDRLSRPWPILACAAVMLAGVVLSIWLGLRNHDGALAAIGRMCGACEHLIQDSRAVVRNGGRCTRCGTQLYLPAA